MEKWVTFSLCANKNPGKLEVSKHHFGAIIIHLGAGVAARRWAISNFALLINSIEKHHEVVLVGTNNEIILYEQLSGLLERPVTNLIGKTNLTETIGIIRDAKLLIGNESAIIHMAAAVNTPSICIVGGGHFKRFIPYDIFIPGGNLPKAVYNPLSCFGCNWQCIYPYQDGSIWKCISDIQVNEVIKLMKEELCNPLI